MKSVILFTTLYLCYSVALTGPVYPTRSYDAREENENRISHFLVDKGDGTYEVEDLTKATVQPRATEKDVTFYLYTQSNYADAAILKNLSTSLPTRTFNPSKEVVIAIHGWRNDFTSPINTYIKDAILHKFDLNFIVVDWNPIAKRNYITARNAVPQIGKYVGAFLESLASTYNIPYSNISIIGHSLGAHVAGIAGSILNGSIDHIVGLDPASPLISVSNKNICLDPSDAKYVQVIHTNGGLLGLTSSIGHSDYFPNGGKRQPGCGIDITGSCAHGKAYEYYAASIQHNQFLSQECPSYNAFTKGRCSGGFSLMGGYSIEREVSGDFYLDTTKDYPFALGATF